jgi:hypothetical protein
MNFFLVRNTCDVDVANGLSSKGYVPVAGTLSIYHMLLDYNIECIPGSAILSHSDEHHILKDVLERVKKFEHAVLKSCHFDPFKAICLANLTKLLFDLRMFKELERRLSAPLYVLSNGSLIRPEQEYYGQRDDSRINAAERARRIPLHLPSIPMPRSYILDFRSNSAKKLDCDISDALIVRLKINAKSEFSNFRSNTIEKIRALLGVQQIKIRSVFPIVSNAVNCDRESLILTAQCHHYGDILRKKFIDWSINFETYRAGIKHLFSSDRRPDYALFNHVRDETLAGICAGLSESGIPCSMKSHGCLVSYGNSARDELAAVLGGAIYNSFPVMSELEPRSPLQVQTTSLTQYLKKTKRVRSGVEPDYGKRNLPFRIYYAPNCQAWFNKFWGMVGSCFDLFECIKAVVNIIKRRSDIHLALRIKTSTHDFAQLGRLIITPKILPADIEHLIDPSQGIFDACEGPHSCHLDHADLVITEGLTAVAFEALEARKPILLLNASPCLKPSLPHVPASRLRMESRRSAVYGASLDDDLAAMFSFIKERHHGLPLCDEELSGLVWL